MFLPFGHIGEQALFCGAIYGQGEVILVSRREDIARGFALGPTWSLCVPLILERIWG